MLHRAQYRDDTTDRYGHPSVSKYEWMDEKHARRDIGGYHERSSHQYPDNGNNEEHFYGPTYRQKNTVFDGAQQKMMSRGEYMTSLALHQYNASTRKY